MGTSVSRLDHIVQTELARRKDPTRTHADFLQRQRTTGVVKLIHEGPSDRGLKPFSLVKRGVVVPDGSVEAPNSEIEIWAGMVVHYQPLDIRLNAVVRVGNEQQFPEHGYSVRKPRGHEEIKRAYVEGIRNCIPPVGRSIAQVAKYIELQSGRHHILSWSFDYRLRRGLW